MSTSNHYPHPRSVERASYRALVRWAATLPVPRTQKESVTRYRIEERIRELGPIGPMDPVDDEQ